MTKSGTSDLPFTITIRLLMNTEQTEKITTALETREKGESLSKVIRNKLMYIKVSGGDEVVLTEGKNKQDPTEKGEWDKMNLYNKPTLIEK